MPAVKYKNQIRQNIKSLAAKNGVSIADVKKYCFSSETKYNVCMRNPNQIKLENIIKLTALCNCTLLDILEGEKWAGTKTKS